MLLPQQSGMNMDDTGITEQEGKIAAAIKEELEDRAGLMYRQKRRRFLFQNGGSALGPLPTSHEFIDGLAERFPTATDREIRSTLNGLGVDSSKLSNLYPDLDAKFERRQELETALAEERNTGKLPKWLTC